jgi:beta-N-acetylhexosaminidase
VSRSRRNPVTTVPRTAVRTAVAVVLSAALAVLAGCQGGGTSQREPATAPVTTPAPFAPTTVASDPRNPSTPATASTRPSATSGRSGTAVGPDANPGGLDDAELIGQLFTAYVYGASADAATPAQRRANISLYGAATGAEIVRRWHLGGIILLDHNTLDPERSQLSTGNVDSAGQIRALTAGLQRAAVADSGVRLLIGTDQEGGPVQRIADGVADRPAELDLAGTDPAQLRCSYFTLGRQLRALGVSQDYAPVADVVRTSTGVIGNRSFGSDPQLDARDVRAAVLGLQDAGVLGTLKHWPGHGSTSTDSHEALAVITESRAQWLRYDRPPFQQSAAVAGSIMVGHLALPALDPSNLPATLSPTLVAGALRRDLGYRRLVLTDSLWMAPMLAAGTPAQVAQWALAAGEDMLLMSPDVPGAYRAVLARVRVDPSFRRLVQAAVGRILAAKASVATARQPGGC